MCRVEGERGEELGFTSRKYVLCFLLQLRFIFDMLLDIKNESSKQREIEERNNKTNRESSNKIAIMTSLPRYMDPLALADLKASKAKWKTVDQGAATMVVAAFDPSLDGSFSPHPSIPIRFRERGILSNILK